MPLFVFGLLVGGLIAFVVWCVLLLRKDYWERW